PESLMQEIVARRQLGQGWTSRLLQRILLGLLTEEHAVKEVDQARSEYRRRRLSFVDALASHDIPVKGSDGINIWVPVADESAAVVRLASQGIGVAPGAPFSILPSDGAHIRVTVGSISESCQELAEKIADAALAGGWSRGR
ncbi:aminotransferase class I/II-fold pyridoxal phosphate-dependent enzyme, partial [Arthrobacter sp. H14]|uniref:aminotransferase class I/II-fold pyridoxal phosphate-dependent enzyme n=1 Tax=Arthrobacter sp. H14 TaxID=1312959 RepID=UPI001C1DF643